jgi:hypothetical protein
MVTKRVRVASRTPTGVTRFTWWVIGEFGSWNAAIAAAGFEPRAAHGGGGNQLRRRKVRERTAAA